MSTTSNIPLSAINLNSTCNQDDSTSERPRVAPGGMAKARRPCSTKTPFFRKGLVPKGRPFGTLAALYERLRKDLLIPMSPWRGTDASSDPTTSGGTKWRRSGAT